MSALRIKFGSTHSITHIDDQTKGKLIVSLACGGVQEITDENRHRFAVIPLDSYGCPFCKMNLDAQKDESQDDHSDTPHA